MSSQRDERLPLLGALGLGGLAATILVVALLRGPTDDSSGSASEAPTTGDASTGAPADSARKGASSASAPVASAEPPVVAMTNAELDAASTAADLEKLSQRFPKEPRVWRKLAAAYDAKAIEPSLKAARRLFEIDATTASDVQMQRIVERAAGGPPPTSDMAFETMTAMMGAAGPDALWDLAVTPSTPSGVAARAWDLLQKDAAVRSKASPALKVAIDLKAHNGCDRKPFIAVAEKEGDKRSLNYLQQLLPVQKCGFLNLSTCPDCFGDRSDIQRAIVAINNREKGTP